LLFHRCQSPEQFSISVRGTPRVQLRLDYQLVKPFLIDNKRVDSGFYNQRDLVFLEKIGKTTAAF
jgi:hypothetical protein